MGSFQELKIEFISSLVGKTELASKALGVMVPTKGLERSKFDYYVPSTGQFELWRKCCSDDTIEFDILKGLCDEDLSEGQRIKMFCERVKCSLFVPTNIQVRSNKLFLAFDRVKLFEYFLKRFQDSVIMENHINQSITIVNQEQKRQQNTGDMSLIRCQKLCRIIRNVMEQFGAEITDQSRNVIRVGCSDRKYLGPEIPCQVGVVLNAKTKAKEENRFESIYEEIFQNHLRISEERSSANEEILHDNNESITQADIQFQLFGHGSVHTQCTIATDRVQDSDFILYNYVRILHILKAFEDQDHPDLKVNDLDFGLLNSDLEWQIGLQCIFPYEDILWSSIQDWQNGKFGFQKIFHFLKTFSKLFSIYYSRIRILQEPDAKHLLPTMFARISLLMTLQKLLLNAMKLIEIKPIYNM